MVKTRISRGVLILAAAAAFSFGAIVNLATADHYHVNCNNHGLVHGSSTADSAYHSRWEGGPCGAYSNCDVGQFNSIIRYGEARGTTCNTFLGGYGPECAGFANVLAYGSSASVGYHRHNAHNRC